ncbi:MAG TPA: DUF3043 domain-containing protein [Nocardioides sp.]|uniref:DUF3043 domain-containing protein n=1 Tax=Nocardioides sp. TaxID=35761 RepID=UPI002EDA0F5D
MFRRKTATETTTIEAPIPAKPGGKGRPTPTRKEAEAARKAAAKQPVTRKQQAAAARARRTESSQRMREALKNGDERYLPARDKGPVRRFVRDYVDTKFTIAELIIPLMLVTMVLGWSGNARLAWFANTFMTLILLAVVGNLVVLRFSLHRQLKRRFPDQSRKGLTYYALIRALQLRFLRLPKPQVKMGQQLPDTYR